MKFKLTLLLMVAVVSSWLAVTQVPAVQDALLGAAAPRALGNRFPESENLRIYVCGSASPLGISRQRAQACLAVITPDHFYLFDAGAGSAANLQADGLPLERLDGVFITHFHSDHIADYRRAACLLGGRSPRAA
ncbi:MAG: MBL fold metallo-hydrolase [Pseudomonadales bacterium]